MKVCFFGTYDKTFASNKLILQGLKENDVFVMEINVHTKVKKMTSKDEISKIQIVKRLGQKLRIFVEIVRNMSNLKKADVLYVGFPGHADVFIAYVLAKVFGKKLVFNPILIIYMVFTEEVRNVSKKSVLGNLIKFGEKLSYSLCDLVFADTPYQKKFLVSKFGILSRKIRVLPLGADNKGYEYSEYKNIGGRKINVVYYGLYSPIHGVEYIIEAANILKNYKDIWFSFVGDGPTFEENYKKAQDLKLENIKFYQNIREGEHLEFVQSADVFLGFARKHPSVDRIVGNKIYQGMVLGRAVLTADAPITKSMFEHKKNIYLCKPSDGEALANALLDLKNDPKLRAQIAKNGYELYLKEFTPSAVAKKLVAYIEKII